MILNYKYESYIVKEEYPHATTTTDTTNTAAVSRSSIARRFVSKTELLGRYLDFKKKTLQKTKIRFLLLK